MNDLTTNDYDRTLALAIVADEAHAAEMAEAAAAGELGDLRRELEAEARGWS